MYTFQYTVGDWSNDGHGQTDVFFIKSSDPVETLSAAFEAGVKIIGHDIRKYCENYEDDMMSGDVAQAFIDHGAELNEIYDGEVYMDADSVLSAIIATIKAGNPEIFLEVDTPVDLCHFIGSVGYGCYT